MRVVQEKEQSFIRLSEEVDYKQYRSITHGVKYSKPLFLDIFMIMAYR